MSKVEVEQTQHIVVLTPAPQVIDVREVTQIVNVNVRVGSIQVEPAVTQKLYINPA